MSEAFIYTYLNMCVCVCMYISLRCIHHNLNIIAINFGLLTLEFMFFPFPPFSHLSFRMSVCVYVFEYFLIFFFSLIRFLLSLSLSRFEFSIFSHSVVESFFYMSFSSSPYMCLYRSTVRQSS